MLTLVSRSGARIGGSDLNAPVAGTAGTECAPKPVLWVRTVAGAAVGFGHLRRVLTLSRILSDCVAPIFLCDTEDRWTPAEASRRGWRFLPYRPEDLWAEIPPPAAVLIDTREESGLLQLISGARVREIPVISIHDLGLNPLPSDLWIDGSVLPVAPQRPDPGTTCHLGTSYMVLEPAFALLHQRPRRLADRVSSVVVNLGGGHSGGAFLKALRGLRHWGKAIEVIGVRGFTEWGQEEIARKSWEPMCFRWAGRHEPVSKLVFRADLALTAGGISAFEALCAGTPLMVLSHDELQLRTAQALARSGACLDLGLTRSVNPAQLSRILLSIDANFPLRERLSARGRQIVDGRGAERVSGLVRQLLLERARRPDPMVV
jgi:UDP-2,4-diacetamido-2,4,6-trideoxy-beta-L-altropyranose hydrolase